MAATLSASPLYLMAEPLELDSIITIVNEGVILSSDLNDLKKSIILNAQAGSLPPDDVLNTQIIDQLILEELQLQEAKKLGIIIDDARLEQAIKAIIKNKNTTLPAFKKELNTNNILWAEYREKIRKEVTISETRNLLVRRRINILPQEVNSLTAQLSEKNQKNVQYRLRHIQLPLSENADKAERDETLKKAKQIMRQMKDNKDMASLALAHSKGPKALNGGDWGWMRAEEMPTLFADKIKNKAKGSMIGPFKSGVGYHLLKIDDLKGLETVAVTEVNARHILIKPSIVLSDEGSKHQLKTIISSIAKGDATFAELAKKHSADPGSAIKGGDLGWQASELYVPEFKDVVDKIETGKISTPFKTVHGWHIVQVTDRRQTDGTDAAMQNRAYGILLNRKFNEEAQTWLQELRASAYVEHIGPSNERN